MSRRREPTIDLDELPGPVRTALEAAILGTDVSVMRHGRELGHLTFRAAVLEGVVMPMSRPSDPEMSAPEGVTVVATAMRLPESARRRLSDELGADYIVLDLNEAPQTADVLLVHAVSPQLLAMLRSQFPRARVIITEIDDDEFGVSLAGPVSRLLEAGATAYLPPRPVGAIAADVHAYLTKGTLPGIGAAAAEPQPPAIAPGRPATPTLSLRPEHGG